MFEKQDVSQTYSEARRTEQSISAAEAILLSESASDRNKNAFRRRPPAPAAAAAASPHYSPAPPPQHPRALAATNFSLSEGYPDPSRPLQPPHPLPSRSFRRSSPSSRDYYSSSDDDSSSGGACKSRRRKRRRRRRYTNVVCEWPLPDARTMKEERSVQRVDMSELSAWGCVVATVAIMVCAVLIFSMRDIAVAWASLAVFSGYAGVVLLLLVPRPKSFDCEMLLLVWTTWLAYGELLHDSEWVFSGSASVLPTFAVLLLVLASYSRRVEHNTRLLSLLVFTFFFLLLFPQRGALSFLIGSGFILLHTFLFVVVFLAQDYVIVRTYGGQPAMKDQAYLFHISLKIVRSVWVLLVHRLALLLVIVQLVYFVRTVMRIERTGIGRKKVEPILPVLNNNNNIIAPQPPTPSSFRAASSTYAPPSRSSGYPPPSAAAAAASAPNRSSVVSLPSHHPAPPPQQHRHQPPPSQPFSPPRRQPHPPPPSQMRYGSESSNNFVNVPLGTKDPVQQPFQQQKQQQHQPPLPPVQTRAAPSAASVLRSTTTATTTTGGPFLPRSPAPGGGGGSSGGRGASTPWDLNRVHRLIDAGYLQAAGAPPKSSSTKPFQSPPSLLHGKGAPSTTLAPHAGGQPAPPPPPPPKPQ